MKRKIKKMNLAKHKVANLNLLFGGNGEDDNTGGPQTEDKKSLLILVCPKKDNSKDGMGCPIVKGDTN